MAKTAPARVLHRVREKETGNILTVQPIDGREMVATGAYEFVSLADDPSSVPPTRRGGLDVVGASGSTMELPPSINSAGPADPLYTGPSGPGTAGTAGDASEPAELPKVADLDEVLAGMTDVAAIVAMSRRDERATAKPKYEARLAELVQ